MLKLVRKAKDSFDGFVNYFTVNNANVYDYFSASGSVHDSNFPSPNVVLNYSAESQWCCAHNDPVIKFTFKCPILLTHYRLRGSVDYSDLFLLSWKVEGMLDDDSWTTIDTKTDRTELKGLGYAHTFECDTQQTVKQIKITATEITDSIHLILSRVEFFGTMNLNKCPLPFKDIIFAQKTCLNQRSHNCYHHSNLLA